MKKEFLFDECLDEGKKGEIVVLDKLRKIYNYTFDYVGDEKTFQAIDVDSVVETGTTVKKIEIKTDYTDYNNIFAEIVSCEEMGTPGWVYKSQADYILYYFKKKNIIYIIDLKILQYMISENRYPKGKAKDKIILKDRIVEKTSIGALIPIVEILKYSDENNIFHAKYIKL